MNEQEFKTSEEWSKILTEWKVLDPDGWDRRNFDYSWFEEKITQVEYNRRLMFSTCRRMELKTVAVVSPSNSERQPDEQIEADANALLIVKLLDLIDRAYHHMKFYPPDKTKMSYNEWQDILQHMEYYRFEYGVGKPSSVDTNIEEKPDVIKFLLGEGELDGKWFGAGIPEGKGPFWWRTELRKIFEKYTPPAKSLQECKDEVAKKNGFKDWSELQAEWLRRTGLAVVVHEDYVKQTAELYASQFKTPPVQEEEIKAKLKAEYQRGYNAAQFNYNVGPYSDNE